MDNKEKEENIETKEKIKEEVKCNSTSKFIIPIICSIVFLITGIFIGMIISNSEEDKSKPEINDNDNEKEEDDKEEEKDEKAEEQDKENESNDDESTNTVELTQDSLLSATHIYVSGFNLFNTKHSCKDNVIDKNCIDSVTILEMIFSKMSNDGAFTNESYDEENLNTIDFASFSTIKIYAKNMFGINDYSEFPNGEKLETNSCVIKYNKLENGYERIKNGPGCSFGAHGTRINNKWYSYVDVENCHINKTTAYVDVLYYYTSGDNLYDFDENILYCTDETKKECVDSFDKLNEIKLTKVRYNFDYKNDTLTFKSAEILS